MFSIQKGKFGMKKLMFSLLVCGSLMAFAEEPAPVAKAPAADKAERRVASQAKELKMSVEEFKKLTPDQVKTKQEEARAERRAKRYGVTVEEYKKMTPEECKAKEAQLKEKKIADQAAKLKMPVEEFKKLTPAERSEKLKAAHKAEREAAKAEREAKKAAKAK